jgi:glycosyltransferase involved in cell wall biosynthesis
MLNDASICVVVPCFNEEKLILRVVETMPEFVDRIVVVDDCSPDNTAAVVKEIISKGAEKVHLISHSVNQGVGGAIASGYKYARDQEFDVAVVMAGDAQMDPEDLEVVVMPVINDECDYSKGNRLYSGDAWNVIPRVRYIGNSLLSLLTKIASGYWHVSDSQSGYTAINSKALKAIDWDTMYKRYGQPNDLLVKLNIHDFRVRDVPIRPVYNIGEKSGVKPIRMIPRLGALIFRLFIYRMVQKYFIRDFHPLIFFYSMAMLVLPSGVILGFYLLFKRLMGGGVAETSALFAVFLVITGFQFLFFGMWMDMENNRDLK